MIVNALVCKRSFCESGRFVFEPGRIYIVESESDVYARLLDGDAKTYYFAVCAERVYHMLSDYFEVQS